jgi:hypothetical protein
VPGVKQESIFVHLKTKHAKGIYFVTDAIRGAMKQPDAEWCAAFTTGELGEMLPSGFCTSGKGWMHDIGLEGEPKMPYGLMEKNEVNVRAKMLIHLIENKKIAL